MPDESRDYRSPMCIHLVGSHMGESRARGTALAWERAMIMHVSAWGQAYDSSHTFARASSWGQAGGGADTSSSADGGLRKV